MSTADITGPLHVRGVVLPENEQRDLWIDDGVVHSTEIPGATSIGVGWITPGLVDLHCHIGLDAEGPVDAATTEAQALTDRATGVLLARDAGSPADTRLVVAREDLPRIIRAGRHIARARPPADARWVDARESPPRIIASGRHIACTRRYMRNYAWEIEREQLADQMAVEARKGDSWVKIVGDWTDREKGDLAPCWPGWALRDGIARAHEHGARVTAHVFSEEPLYDLIDAGIDGIEHGTGLTPELIATMAERGMSLVPTLVNIGQFPTYAAQGEGKFPTYAKHMRALHASRHDVTRGAHEAGVTVLAGTDADGMLPHGLIADEIDAIIEAGVPAETAFGAASWTARAYLQGGTGSLESGGPADLCLWSDDPRLRTEWTRRPERVVLRGRLVT